MNNTTLLAVGALIATFVASFKQIKEFFLNFSGFFVYRITCSSSAFNRIMFYFITDKWKPFSNKSLYLDIFFKQIKSKNCSVPLIHESFLSKTSTIYRKGLKFIILDAENYTIIIPKYVKLYDLISKANDIDESIYNKMFGHISVKKHYCRVLEGSRFLKQQFKSSGGESSSKNPPEIPSYTLFNAQELSIPVGVDNQEFCYGWEKEINLWLNDEMQEISNEVSTWYTHKKWFVERNVPWKRGYLFYGDPGTGKTKFSKYLAESIDLPLYIFDLASMNNNDFIHEITAASNFDKVILLEDIDAIFDKRKNLTSTEYIPGLTFDCLLNNIDGATTTNGTILIITTNDISKLDDALIRPGRVDRRIKLPNLSKQGREWMANKIFKDISKDKYYDLVDSFNDISGAAFQEECCKRAYKLFWEKSI